MPPKLSLLVPESVETTAAREEKINEAGKRLEVIEDSDLDTDDEMAEEVGFDSDTEEEDDYYTDAEDDSESECDDTIEEEEEENQSLEKAIETAVYVSERAGVIALRVSKVAAFWVRQWSWDIYRACERAVDACREELALEDFSFTDTKADKDLARLQRLRKKTWRVTKRSCRTLGKMAVAFWTMDDDDILDDSDVLELEAIKPKFSFLDKLKLRSSYEEVENDSDDDEGVDDAIEPKEEVEEACSPKRSRRSRRKKHKRESKHTTETASIRTTKAPEKDETKAVVTVVPRVKMGRRVIVGVAVGVACGFCWEQFGAAALITKGISKLHPKLKPWKEASEEL
ncbi:MAG: hypothetical protein SGBAC_013537 [Bacillariaceae sp.]